MELWAKKLKFSNLRSEVDWLLIIIFGAFSDFPMPVKEVGERAQLKKKFLKKVSWPSIHED